MPRTENKSKFSHIKKVFFLIFIIALTFTLTILIGNYTKEQQQQEQNKDI